MGQEDPQSRKWQTTPVVLPGEAYGQRSLTGYSPLGHEELDTIENVCTHTGVYLKIEHF